MYHFLGEHSSFHISNSLARFYLLIVHNSTLRKLLSLTNSLLSINASDLFFFLFFVFPKKLKKCFNELNKDAIITVSVLKCFPLIT